MALAMFLKLTDIKGESSFDGFKDQIQLQSYSFGATNVVGGSRQHSGGANRGQVSVTEFTVSANMGLHSAPLFKALVANTHIKEVVMTKLATSGNKHNPYVIITMSDCLVSSFMSADSAGSDHQGAEQVSFNYGKILFKYNKLKASDGTPDGGNEAFYDAINAKF